MKTLSIICLALIATISAWAQQPAVGNSKVNTDFSKYKTFTWAKSDATLAGPDGYDIYYYEYDEPAYKNQKKAKNKSAKTVGEPYIYSYSVIIPATDENANGIIADAISNELEGRGYQEQASNGDLIVAYHVLDRKAKLHGYKNDYPTTIAGGREVRQPSDTTTFALEPGTLMISLIDAKTSQVVWNGFANEMNVNNVFVTEEVKLREAVHDIFDQFKYTADKARRN